MENKKVYIGKEKIDIHFPTRFTKKTYGIKDIASWKEEQVKTATGTYKELEVLFQSNYKLNLSYQEHTDYPAVVRYLKKKCGRKFKG